MSKVTSKVDQNLFKNLSKLNSPVETPIQKVAPVEKTEKKEPESVLHVTIPKSLKKKLDVFCADQDVFIRDVVITALENHIAEKQTAE